MKTSRRYYPKGEGPIPFYFRQTKEDFIVDEIPLGPWKGRGNFIILRVRKQNLSTWELLDTLAAQIGCGKHEIGYAGLKDKYATTTQYLSLPKAYKKSLSNIRHKLISIEGEWLHESRLSIGDLEGNRFTIRLHKLDANDATRLEAALVRIQREGFANYFGYQRFGKEEENIQRAREVATGERFVKEKRLKKFQVATYQSQLFNDWLVRRLKLNGSDCGCPEALEGQKQPLKLLPGDVVLDYATQKWENVKEPTSLKKALRERKKVITGLLAGEKSWRAQGCAGEIEKEFDALIEARGDRRSAWVFAQKIEHRYDAQSAQMLLSFTLPKGAYATVLLESASGRDLTPKR